MARLEAIGCGELEEASTAKDEAAVVASGFEDIFEDDDPLGMGEVSTKKNDAIPSGTGDEAENPEAGRQTENLLDSLF